MDPVDEEVTHRVLTVPNLITFARLALVPAFLYLFLTANSREGLLAAFVLLALLGSTDWVDGFVARKTHQVSVLGKVIDPVADRIAIIAVVAGLMLRDDRLIPWTVAAAIVGRDLIVAVVFGVLESRGFPRVPVNRTGKAATACIFAGVALVTGSLAADPSLAGAIRELGAALLTIGALLYWAAGYLYVVEIRRRVRARVA